MAAEVKVVEQCDACNQFKPEQRKEPMLTLKLTTQPWERIAADLFHSDGSDFLLIVDYFSDWWEIERLSDFNSQSVVKKTKSIFARFGIPEVLVSDNGPQFVSKEFRSFMKQWGVDQVSPSAREMESGISGQNSETSDKEDDCGWWIFDLQSWNGETFPGQPWLQVQPRECQLARQGQRSAQQRNS